MASRYAQTEILPNELSEFASPNYTLTLYTIPKNEFQQQRLGAFSGNRKFSQKIIIAESGSTAMQINNLSIDTIPLQQQGSIASTLRMDIIHTRGHGLIESQFAAAKLNGWTNPLEMIYLLEIAFLGRMEDNTEIQSTKMTFPILLTQVTTNIDQSSSTYNITAALLPAVMNDYSYSKIPQNMVVGGGQNILSFFNNFAAKLNAIEEDKIDNINISRAPLKHRFEIDQRFINAQVGTPNAQDASKSNKSLYSYDADENAVSITNGSTIQSFIDNIMQNSPEIQSMVTDVEDFKFTHLVNPVINVTGFDNLSGKNTYEVNWQIISTYKRFYSNNTTTEDTIASKLFAGINNIKLYDYMYTGLNTEVKSINVDTNNLYYAKIQQYLEKELQINKNQGRLGNNNVSFVDDKKQNSMIDARKNPYESDAKNLRDSNGVIYVDDLPFNEFEYMFFEPKVVYNAAESTNKASDQPVNLKNKQYDYDLEFIRNSSKVSFMSAEIKIKGDPYWIAPPGLLPDIESRSMYTENVLILRFNYPSNDLYSENQTINHSSVYTGFYYIHSVTSTFNNGRFEQTLKGPREPKISPRIINDFLKSKGV